MLSVVLAACLVFGYSYKQPVKAEALVTTTAGTIGLVALMSTLGCAIGIGIGGQNSHGDWTYYYKQIGDYVTNKFATIGKKISDSGVLDFINDQANGYKTYHVSDDLMKATYEGFVATFPPGTPIGQVSNNTEFAKKMGWSQTFNPPCYAGAVPWGTALAVYALQNVCLIKTYTKADLPFNRNGLKLSIADNSYHGCFTLSVSNSMGSYFKNVATFIPFTNGCFELDSYQWAEFSAYDPATKCDVWLLLDNVGATGYEGFKDAATTPADPTNVNTHDPYVPGNTGLYAQGHSVMNNSYDDVMAKIKAAQGTLDGINVRISDAVGSLQQINDQVKAQTQSQVLGQSIADTATDAAADAATNAGRDVSIPKIPTMPDITLPTGIQRKFPFCLPWDLSACYRLFQVTPQAPVWNVPVNIDVGMIHVHRTYTYDLNSNGVLDKGITVFKWFEDLLFVFGLILVTKKIMS